MASNVQLGHRYSFWCGSVEGGIFKFVIVADKRMSFLSFLLLLVPRRVSKTRANRMYAHPKEFNSEMRKSHLRQEALRLSLRRALRALNRMLVGKEPGQISSTKRSRAYREAEWEVEQRRDLLKQEVAHHARVSAGYEEWKGRKKNGPRMRPVYDHTMIRRREAVTRRSLKKM